MTRRIVGLIVLLVSFSNSALAGFDSWEDLCTRQPTAEQLSSGIRNLSAEIEQSTGRQLAQLHWFRGDVHRRKSELSAAIEDYNRALGFLNAEVQRADDSVRVARARILAGRGMAYRDSGQYDLAFQDFDAARLLDPTRVDIYAYRGTVFDRMARHDQAIDEFNRIIEANSDDEATAKAFAMRAAVKANRGAFAQARRDLS